MNEDSKNIAAGIAIVGLAMLAFLWEIFKIAVVIAVGVVAFKMLGIV